jgi:hypothetical protein
MNLRGIKIDRTVHEYSIKCDPTITQKIKERSKKIKEARSLASMPRSVSRIPDQIPWLEDLSSIIRSDDAD